MSCPLVKINNFSVYLHESNCCWIQIKIAVPQQEYEEDEGGFGEVTIVEEEIVEEVIEIDHYGYDYYDPYYDDPYYISPVWGVALGVALIL